MCVYNYSPFSLWCSCSLFLFWSCFWSFTLRISLRWTERSSTNCQPGNRRWRNSVLASSKQCVSEVLDCGSSSQWVLDTLRFSPLRRGVSAFFFNSMNFQHHEIPGSCGAIWPLSEIWEHDNRFTYHSPPTRVSRHGARFQYFFRELTIKKFLVEFPPKDLNNLSWVLS